MYPVGRLAKVLIAARRRTPLGPFDDSVVSFRVWPLDLDTNGHLNNGRYLTLMDLGRWDLTGRMGVLAHARRERWMPVVAASTIRYRKSLGPFQRYDLRTRLLGWDGKAFFFQQTFERGGEVHATAAVRAVLLRKGGRVPPQEAVDLLEKGLASPPLPAWVQLWARALEAQAEPAPAGVKST